MEHTQEGAHAPLVIEQRHLEAVEQIRLYLADDMREESERGASLFPVVRVRGVLEAYDIRTAAAAKSDETAKQILDAHTAQVSRTAQIEGFAKTVNGELRKIDSKAFALAPMVEIGAATEAELEAFALRRIIASQADDRERLEARIAELKDLVAESHNTPASLTNARLAKEKIKCLQEAIKGANEPERVAYVSGLEQSHAKTLAENAQLQSALGKFEGGRAWQDLEEHDRALASLADLLDKPEEWDGVLSDLVDELRDRCAEIAKDRMGFTQPAQPPDTSETNFRHALYRYWCKSGIRAGELEIVRERFPESVPAAWVCREPEELIAEKTKLESTITELRAKRGEDDGLFRSLRTMICDTLAVPYHTEGVTILDLARNLVAHHKQQKKSAAHLLTELEKANAENVALHGSHNLIAQMSAWVEGLSNSVELARQAFDRGEFSPLYPVPAQAKHNPAADDADQVLLESRQPITPPLSYGPECFGGSDIGSQYDDPRDRR